MLAAQVTVYMICQYNLLFPRYIIRLPQVILKCVTCLCRYKNGQLLRKEDYRIRPRNDALVIRGITEKDAGNYTVVLSNKNTKEEQKRSLQLLVNGMYTLLLFPFSSFPFLPELPDPAGQLGNPASDVRYCDGA